MLQQTQVATVIPYFKRFIDTFPDIDSLANAHTDDVLTRWAGLGYYARGRNLHRAAIAMQQSHHSKVPDDYAALIALPGIGRSTAGAILALAYGQPYPILDGNVRRVLARYDAIPNWPGEKATEVLLWQRAEQLLPEKRLKDYTQAQMDLGATVCTRSKPKCGACPLQANCKAFQTDAVNLYPVPKPKKISPLRQKFWLVSVDEGTVLLEQQPDKGIWGGLWSFPAFDNALQLKQQLATDDQPITLPQIRHIFTHFKLDITPILTHQKVPISHSKQRWVKIEHISQLALPAPVEKFITSQLVKRFL
jgi:A/G-specific adenine glycosylase